MLLVWLIMCKVYASDRFWGITKWSQHLLWCLGTRVWIPLAPFPYLPSKKNCLQVAVKYEEKELRKEMQ